jgi:hypothetical protein
MAIINRIGEFQDDMTAWRRDFHQHPEIAFEEVRTSGVVAEKLRAFGLDEVHTGIGRTGVVGVLKGRAGGGAIGLRADMDALPIQETTGLDYASTIPGKMHACGHDGHTTMLLGAARYLAETRNFEGTVYFIFQPAEEGEGGGRVMIDEDVMRMAEEIGDSANTAAFVKAKRAAKEPITGFGHRVYRAEDPRARHMREGVQRLSKEMGEPKWYEILEALVAEMKPYARHGVNVNVDFYSGVIYYLHRIAKDLFVPIFAVGRVPGWTVQVLEQLDNNILIRPLTLYTGPEARPYVSIGARG